MKKYTPEEIQQITESVSVLDYFRHLENKGIVSFNRKTGHDHYFLTESNKFSVNDDGFYDFKTGEGGKIIKAVMQLENKSWKEAIDFLKDFSNTGITQNAEKRQGRDKNTSSATKPKINHILRPNNDKLLQYFEERGISSEVLQANTKQVHYAVNDKKYFGIGLKNDSEGYEIRNPFMKTKLGTSDIATIKGEKNAMVVFEGMTDMLSFLQLSKDNNMENKHNLVVLNSVTNADRFIDKYKDYTGKIFLLLDGDKAGDETTQKILEAFQYKNIEDARYKYDIGGANKDLNDYLKNKNALIKEKNTNLAKINNQLGSDETTRIESKRLSASESMGREETQRNDRELNTPSQSEQGGNLRERQTMDSNDAGDGLSPSERIDLGRGGRVGTTLLGTQQSRVKGTGIIHEEGYRGTGESVRGSESSQHDNNRGEQNQADNGGRFTRRGESGSPRQNVGERNGTRDEGVPQNQNTSSERLAILIQEIKNLPKPSNEQITEAVNLVASVSSNHQITLNENATLYEKELKGIISQYQSGGITKIKGEKGVLDEYYTDTKIVEAVRNLIQDNFKNQKNIKVLEPSVGIGNFINATKELPKSNITAFEINETTAKIAKILHPETTINLRSFETEFIDDKGRKKDFTPKYDLVIGNPPYGQHRGYYYGLGEESKISRYEDYFVKRSLDVLKEGGVLAMILPSSYLNRQSKLNNAEMVEAFRLPNGVFKGTDVGTDILILKKNSQIQDNDISNYFNLEENQKRVLGEIGIKTNRYGREESYVKGDLESALQQIKELKKDSYKAEEARQLNLFEDFTEEQDTIKEQTNAEKEEQKQENTILDTAREKVNQAKDTLENIKFKSLAIQDEIENYFQLGHKLEDEPEQFTNENLEEIIKKAESVIKITKKKNDDYTLQTTPEIKKGILKYHFQKQDEIVEAGLQNNSNISQKQLKAFQDTYYDGSIEYKEENKEFASFENGVWKNNFYYAEGNIYEKLDQLELDKTLISEKQYNKQKQLLESVLPKPKSLEEIIISPNHEFVHKLHLRNEEKEFYSPLRASYYKEMVNISMADDFKEFLRKLPSEAFGSSSSWEVSGFVNNENVTGNDRERNALVRERRKEVANDLFNKYLREEISDEVKELFVSEFNRKHNNIYVPDYSQFPMFSKINKNFKGKPLELTEVQKAGIGRQTTKGVGLLAHEVGFGKTLSGILAMHEAMERGYATRPLIVVPNNNILKQWVETIFEAIPEAKVNVLGNLGKDYDLSKFNNRDGEITIVTYEGFNNIGFSEDITKRLASQFEYISSQEMKSLQNSSARDVAKEREKEREIEGKMKKGKVYDWEDFGFDHLTFDEVHNANHIVGKVKIESRSFASDFRSQNQRTSKLGINTWMAAQYIQEQNNGRNITLLSATPFTNKPLEYYSILSLIANDRLEEAGFLNVNNFFETFMEADNDMEINAKGDVQFKTNVRRFKNNALFQQLLSEFIDIKGEEDNPELIRPNRINKEYKIEQNQLTEEQFEELNNQYDETKDGAILTHILNARLTAISPYLSPYYEGDKPTNKEFIENSPKLDATMKLIAQNKKDKPEAGQIIYSEIAVDEFPRFKKYLVDEVGYKDKEVAIISGGTSKSQREKIQEDFNEGKIKVIIGSSAIQEGMNLQENTTDMYLLSLPYNFTSLRQTEGRMWRQGNKWENVRVNYMLTNDSIDVFMLQTLQNKQQRYLEAMKKGADVVDVSDIDTQALKTAIITNPKTRANIEIELMRKKLEKEKERYEADNAFSLRKFEKYTKAKEAENKALGQVNLYKRYLENNSSEDSYWKGALLREEKNYQDRVKDTEKVIESMAKQGVDVVSFQEKIKANEEKVAEVDDKIMDLENFEKELIQKYTNEKQRLLQEKSQINIAEERAEENKTFFKLRDNQNAEKETIQMKSSSFRR